MTQGENRPTAPTSKPVPPDEIRPPERARHGYRNEVSWRGGAGRQPYTNQEPGAPDDPAAAGEFEQGDRGVHSGVTQEQMERVRGTP